MANRWIESKGVRASSLHVPLPVSQHAYVLPFLVLYLAWLFLFSFNGFHDLTLEGIFKGKELYVFLLGLIVSSNIVAFLSCHWSVTLRAKFTCAESQDPLTAAFIRVIPAKHRGLGMLCELSHQKIHRFGQEEECVSFIFQQRKFILDQSKRVFKKLETEESHELGFFLDSKGFAAKASLLEAEQIYGLNKFEIPVPTFKELFKEHAVAPFFVFQLFCVALWCLDEFWYYSLFTLFMLVVFESTVVQQRIKALKEFRTMSIKPFQISVKRQNAWTLVSSDSLLPGDLCSVSLKEEEFSMPCDLLLLEGTCVVNEAMLSGESTPLLKECIESIDKDKVLDIVGDHRRSVLFGGTKLLQVNPSSKSETPDGGCLAYVLRTGFQTTQGKLVRTMVYSTERITANNLESLLFILFLLIFAVAASVYVWIKGVEDGTKSKYKLLLECVLIITAVVPPELPMELSLAVNNSLMALSKFGIFCTEPFRIPFAGKVDVCCFDKTGTLTEEKLNLDGLIGVDAADPHKLVDPKNIPEKSALVLASCHSLIFLNGQIVGDPMEMSTLTALSWKLESDDVTVSGPKSALKILKRFQFLSALKRMSCIFSFRAAKYASVKGAPEIMKGMFKSVPKWYDQVYEEHAKKGSRVIALGLRELSKEFNLAYAERESIEKDLEFMGFLLFTCPIKDQSKQAVKNLMNSSHHVVMITGDSPLTAIHVAKELDMVDRPVLTLECDGSALLSTSTDEKYKGPFDLKDLDDEVCRLYCLCLTSDAIDAFLKEKRHLLHRVFIYARASPKQKEDVLTAMKESGYITLMCGDGTNDVGALKQAHIGVALLDGKPEDLEKIMKRMRLEMMKQKQEELKKTREEFSKRFGRELPGPGDQENISVLIV